MNARDVLDSYNRLSPRERAMVGIAGGALILISLYAFIWEPLTTGQERMEKKYVTKQRELETALELRDRYHDLSIQLELGKRILMQEKSFPLLQHLEKTVEAVVARDHIASMNPASKTTADAYREEQVELRLNDITLGQLVDMLHRIEKGVQPLRVTRLHIKKTRKQGFFEITAVVSTLYAVQEPKEAKAS